MNRDTWESPAPDEGGLLSRLEDRTIALLERWLGWSLPPPGVGWAHTLGSVLLTLLGLQALTGLVLALYYCPSPDAAWESIRYIDTAVVLGSDRRVIVALGGAGTAATLLLLGLALRGLPSEPAGSTSVLTVTARRRPSARRSSRAGPAGAVPDHVTGVGAAAAAGTPAAGEKLYAALRCASCHEGAGAIGPDLSQAGSRWQGRWLADYLRAPARVRWSSMGVRPVARMPDFGLSQQESADLAAFLETHTDADRFPAPSSPPPDGAADEGRQLFADYQCLGCHRLEGEGSDIGPALDGVGGKLTPGFLRAFLTKPDDIVPGTPMKEVELWPKEAAALTAYLSTLEK